MTDRGGSSVPYGTFSDRLGEFVLLSYATGQAVEGEWFLVNGHRMVPDMNVSVTRIEGGRETLSQEVTVAGTDTRPFEVKLESFLLAEYAAGESVEGTWALRYARRGLPAWDVEIEFGDVAFETRTDEFTLRSRS